MCACVLCFVFNIKYITVRLLLNAVISYFIILVLVNIVMQVADWMFQLTKNCQSPFIKTKCQIIIQWLGIDWSRNVSWSYLRKPLYSGIGAALYTLLVLNGQPVPKDPLVQAKLLSVKHLEVNRSTELGEQGERYNGISYNLY